MHSARNPPPPVDIKDHVYVWPPVRPRPVRYQGEHYTPLPKLPQPEPPVATLRDNPMSVEPFSFPTPREKKPHWRDKLEVRRVTEADLNELMDWGIKRIEDIYPRCTNESIFPLLKQATHDNRMGFFRTESACGLFIAERTPWEPELTVYCAFVVAKKMKDDDLNLEKYAEPNARIENQFRVKSLGLGLQPTAIYQAGDKWAKEIGAVAFMYGPETGTDITPIAEKIGFDRVSTGYVKLYKKE